MGRTKKSDLALIVNSDIAIYENKLIQLMHDFMTEYNYSLDDLRNHYRHLLLYISKNVSIDKTRLNDYEYLLSLFNVYTNLCDIIGYNPTYGMFLRVYNITNNDVKIGLNNRYSMFIGIIDDTCKSRIIDTLANDRGNNRNLQFIAASVYGISEINAKKGNSDQIVLTNKELAEQIGVVD